MSEPPAKKKKKRGAWPLYLIFIGLAVLMGVGIHSTGRARRAAKAYVAAIQEGDLDAAYSMLTEGRQREISREEFEHVFRTPELMAGKRPAWDYASNGSNGQGCAEAGISIDGKSRGLRVFLLREDGELKVHQVQVYGNRIPEGPWHCKSSVN